MIFALSQPKVDVQNRTQTLTHSFNTVLLMILTSIKRHCLLLWTVKILFCNFHQVVCVHI